MIDFRAFEAFEEEKPSLLLDRHPNGKHLAMQIETADAFLAAIWNTETKQLAWFPQDAHGLAWMQQGTQIAALQNPVLSEDFFFAIYSWPQRKRLQQCPLRFPLGYLFNLIVSPTSDLAVCQWTDQCKFGFEFIALHDQSAVHLTERGYLKTATNLSTRPVFHPHGRFWICAYQDNPNWWLDEVGKPVKEGEQKKMGALMVFHQTHLLGEIPLIVTVPADHRPPSMMASGFFTQEADAFASAVEENPYLSDPVFIDAHHIATCLPSGESQIHDLSGFLSEGLP